MILPLQKTIATVPERYISTCMPVIFTAVVLRSILRNSSKI
ncbi:Uncharacterised protein [Vibrio cholerae]|nr:Uncharacterised protein [Vibrio cholerae]